MEKTAMQILIDEMQMMKSEINNKESWVIKTIDVVTQRATELLEKEREVEKTVEERAKELYPEASNEEYQPEVSGEAVEQYNSIQRDRQKAYIKGAMEHQNK